MDGSQAVWRELHGKLGQKSGGGWTLPLSRRLRVVADAVETLPERSRVLLALRYYEGLGVEELSDALGLTPKEVHGGISLAVTSIHRALTKAEEEWRAGERA
jgi:DNA-directed RNA polymerase specialized sigma24 family protein